jgi:hypothetical protein
MNLRRLVWLRSQRKKLANVKLAPAPQGRELSQMNVGVSRRKLPIRARHHSKDPTKD